MEEQQEDNRHTGVRHTRRSEFKRGERGEHISYTLLLGWLFIFNVLTFPNFWSLKSSTAVLVSLQLLVIVICIVLIWRHGPDVNPTQYLLIALGFYLLMFGLCVGIGIGNL